MQLVTPAVQSRKVKSRTQDCKRTKSRAVSKSICITNTCFKLYTWTSAVGPTKKQTDYIVLPAKYRNAILNFKACLKTDCVNYQSQSQAEHEISKKQKTARSRYGKWQLQQKWLKNSKRLSGAFWLDWNHGNVRTLFSHSEQPKENCPGNRNVGDIQDARH